MISAADITDAVRRLGVQPADTLVVHSSVRAALRVAGDRVTDKLDTIVDGLRETVADGVLIMPTFTYSACEGEPYDVQQTPSTVGALTEHFRRRPGVRRTADPIFSNAILGSLPAGWEHLFEIGDVNCFGDDSAFAYMRDANAKLLFFGVGMDYCTFIHNVEQRLGVPYRYLKRFRGLVRDGAEAEVNADYFVRRLDGSVELYMAPLQESLLRSGSATQSALPDGPTLLITDAASVVATVRDEIGRNPHFLLRSGHAPDHAAVRASAT